MRSRRRQIAGFAAALLGIAFSLSATPEDRATAIIASIDVERARLDRPPMTVSPILHRLAEELAEEVGAGTSLEFEVIGGSELLLRARALGYAGVLVSPLAAVDDRSGCEIVADWNQRLGASEAYRRPEATEIGIAVGFVRDLPLTVVVVGVPRSVDPLRKRWPGVAPKENLEADFFRLVNENRFRSGLPLFTHSEDLDADAQTIADEVLFDVRKEPTGAVLLAGGTALYCKGEGFHATDLRYPISVWQQSARIILSSKGAASAGVGLASRGRNDRVEAVWVLLVRPMASAKE